MRYFIADTHFNHENIIKYCNRPFKNSKEMNEYIISKWNSVVTKDDIVYHLGDVGFGSTEELKKLVSSLNGTKILIRGNHYVEAYIVKEGICVAKERIEVPIRENTGL